MHSDIRIHGRFKLKRMGELLTEQLTGQPVSEHNRIEQIELTGDDEWLYAVLGLSGRFNGAINAQFKLSSDPESSNLIVDEIKLKLENGGLITAGANFVLKHFLTDKLRDKVQKQLSESMTNVISEVMHKYKVIETEHGLNIQTKMESYNFEEVTWDSSNLYCKFVASSVINVVLD